MPRERDDAGIPMRESPWSSQQAKLLKISDSSKLAVPLSFHVRGNKSCAAFECLIARGRVGRRERKPRGVFPRRAIRGGRGLRPVKSLFRENGDRPDRRPWARISYGWTSSKLRSSTHSHVPDCPERDWRWREWKNKPTRSRAHNAVSTCLVTARFLLRNRKILLFYYSILVARLYLLKVWMSFNPNGLKQLSNTRGQFELKLSENEISLLFLAIARASSRYDLHCNSQRHCWYRRIIVAQVFYMIENLRNDNMTILKMLQKQLQNYSAGDNTAAATAEWRRIKIETKERRCG